MNDLEKLIELSKVVSKPWVIATYVLAVLLFVSVLANIYVLVNGTEIIISADENMETSVTQIKG